MSFKSKNGDRIPISLSATWIYDAQRQCIGSVGCFEELRSIKEAQGRFELLLQPSNIVAHAENLTVGLQSLAEMVASRLDHTLEVISI
jgi:hypothetical protein